MTRHEPLRRGILLTAASGLALAGAQAANAQQAPSPAVTQTSPPLTAEPQAAPTDQAASPSQTAGEQGVSQPATSANLTGQRLAVGQTHWHSDARR